MLVYMLINTSNNKAYVGKTINTLEDRWYKHCTDSTKQSNMPVHIALRNSDPILWEQCVLCYCNSKAQLKSAEAYWIDYCETNNPDIGYNARREGVATVPRVRNKNPTKKNIKRAEKKITNWKNLSAEERHTILSEAGKRGARKSEELRKSKKE